MEKMRRIVEHRYTTGFLTFIGSLSFMLLGNEGILATKDITNSSILLSGILFGLGLGTLTIALRRNRN